MKPNDMENLHVTTLRRVISPGHTIEVRNGSTDGWHFVIATFADPSKEVATLRKDGQSEWSLVDANGTVIAGPVKFISLLHDHVVEFVSFP